MSFARYPNYQNSGVEWLGEVPGHWETMQFKRLASIQNGRDYKHIETDSDDGYPVIGSGGAFTRATEYLFSGESVLLGRKGTIDKPLYINGPFWVVDTMFYTLVNNKAVPKYLYYCALTIRFDLYSTSTALPSMTQNDLGGIIFAIPDLAEQQTIAAYLDRETAKIDALIAEQQRLIELLKEKRQAVISHAVTKGLNPAAPMKDSGIEWLGEVPEHWEVCALKHVVSTPITDGPHETPNFPDEGIPFVSAEAIATGVIDFSKIRGFISKADHIRYSQKYHPQVGDIYMVKSGATTGVAAIVETDVDFNIWSPLAAIRCGESAVPRFILNYMRSKNFQEAVTLNWSFGTQQNIGMRVIEKLAVTLPPKLEQLDISSFLDSETTKLNTLTTEAQRAIDLLKERRTALISAAVTGKIDVRCYNQRANT